MRTKGEYRAPLLVSFRLGVKLVKRRFTRAAPRALKLTREGLLASRPLITLAGTVQLLAETGRRELLCGQCVPPMCEFRARHCCGEARPKWCFCTPSVVSFKAGW